jgi:hypothetical protein
VARVRRSLSICLAAAVPAAVLIVGALSVPSLHRAPPRAHVRAVAARVSIPAPGHHRFSLRLPTDWGVEATPDNGVMSLERSDTCAHASLLATPAPAGPPAQAARKLLGQIEGSAYDPSKLVVGRVRLPGADQALLAVQAPLQAVLLAHRGGRWTAIVMQASFPQRCHGPRDARPLLRALLAGRLGDERR